MHFILMFLYFTVHSTYVYVHTHTHIHIYIWWCFLSLKYEQYILGFLGNFFSHSVCFWEWCTYIRVCEPINKNVYWGGNDSMNLGTNIVEGIWNSIWVWISGLLRDLCFPVASQFLVILGEGKRGKSDSSPDIATDSLLTLLCGLEGVT